MVSRKIYKATAEIKTPIHITGSEISKFEYYMDGEYAVIYDIDDIDYNSLELMHKHLNKKLLDTPIQHLVFDVKPFVSGSNEIRRIQFHGGGNKDIKLIPFQNGSPYIPGSSIKGWIRKSYIVDCLKTDHKSWQDIKSKQTKQKNLFDAPFVSKLPARKDASMSYKDIFKQVSISDAFPIGDWKTEILTVEKWGNKHGEPVSLPVYAEFITLGTFEFTISIPDTWNISDVSRWSNGLFDMIKEHEDFKTKNVPDLHFPERDRTMMILGRFSGMLTKTILSLGFDPWYEYLFKIVVESLEQKRKPNKRLISALRYMMNNKHRRNPLYVKHGEIKSFPGVVSVSFEEM